MKHIVRLAKICETCYVTMDPIARMVHRALLRVLRAIWRGACGGGVECVARIWRGILRSQVDRL